jgi:hypothetical protein
MSSRVFSRITTDYFLSIFAGFILSGVTPVEPSVGTKWAQEGRRKPAANLSPVSVSASLNQCE